VKIARKGGVQKMKRFKKAAMIAVVVIVVLVAAVFLWTVFDFNGVKTFITG
jgi:hypothetical protein